MRAIGKMLLLLLLLGTRAFAQGTVLWDESVNGPLSYDYTQPTQLGTLQNGSNFLLGSSEFVPTGGGPGGVVTSDFVVFTIGAGNLISSLMLQTDLPLTVWIGDTTFSSELASVISALRKR